jgi:hypothetical protein
MEQKIIEKAKIIFSKRYGRPISDYEAKKILTNLVGFGKIIAEWEAKEREQQKIP